jgi:hypothetical protein
MSKIENLVKIISRNIGREKDMARCDLAEQIWASQLTDEEVVSLLHDPNPRVRGTVAWAVADNNGPELAVRWLAKHGIHDESQNVRFWSIMCIAENPKLREQVTEEEVEALCNDDCPEIRTAARRLWDGRSEPPPST